MIPMELKRDKDGLLYFDDKQLSFCDTLKICNPKEKDVYYPCGFYAIPSTNEYIIKYVYTVYTRKEMQLLKEMLLKLKEKQSKVPSVDFPIGYCSHNKKIVGQIIKNYPEGISLEKFYKSNDLIDLDKYFSHGEDNIYNLFLLFRRVNKMLEEMFENGIYYTDIHPGNVILTGNDAKIIDFDYRYVTFTDKDKRLINIMNNFALFVDRNLLNCRIYNDINISFKNFDDAKTKLKKMENNVRSSLR